jgi:hypothetical protein
VEQWSNGAKLEVGLSRIDHNEAEQRQSDIKCNWEKSLANNKAATVSRDMELWVSGFNAWGQLAFEGESSTDSSDLRSFVCVLRNQYIEILRTSLSATLGKSKAIAPLLL